MHTRPSACAGHNGARQQSVHLQPIGHPAERCVHDAEQPVRLVRLAVDPPEQPLQRGVSSGARMGSRATWHPMRGRAESPGDILA